MAVRDGASDFETAIQLAFQSLSTGYACIRNRQKEAVLAVLCGKDVFVGLPTAYGKTVLTAVLPGVFDRMREEERHFMVLCICPLISLMMDQRRRLRLMGVTADFMGTAQEDKSAMHAIVSGQVQCILASPETILNNQMARDVLQSPIYQRYLAAVVIDEAHCISHWLVACQYTNQYSKASIHAESLITRCSRLQEPLHHLYEEFDTETAASATSILQQKHSGPNLNKDIRVGANSLQRRGVRRCWQEVGARVKPETSRYIPSD